MLQRFPDIKTGEEKGEIDGLKKLKEKSEKF